MTYYAVLTHTVDDPERYVRDYVPDVVPLIARHGGEVLVAMIGGTGFGGSS